MYSWFPELVIITAIFTILFYIFFQFSVFVFFSDRILRMFNNVRRLETSQEKEKLRPIFNEVYNKAKEADPELASPRIEICIVDSIAVNAYALGTKTVAVTKGALDTFSEDELKAVIAHEISHLKNFDTIAKSYVLVGNGIITFNIIIVKLAYWLMKKIPSLRPFVEITDKVFDGFVFVFLLLSNIVLAIDSRYSERKADYYAVELGYGEDMVKALYVLESISLRGIGGIIEKLTASHPRVTSRIEALEIALGVQEDERDRW